MHYDSVKGSRRKEVEDEKVFTRFGFLIITSQAEPEYIKIDYQPQGRTHSDEGLTLETSVFESFTVVNLLRPCG